MSFGFGDMFSPTCRACGATIGDIDLHQAFHDALGQIARLVHAPDLSQEEWDAQVEAARPAAEALVEAERAVRKERDRQAFRKFRAEQKAAE